MFRNSPLACILQGNEFGRLIDTANAPIFGVDSRGAVNVWNQHASRVVGFSAEKTFGRPFVSDFITEDFRASVQDVLDKALLGDETANLHLPLMTKSGARVEILLNATSRKDAEEHIIGVVGIGQDITARIAQVSLEMFMNATLLNQGTLTSIPEKKARGIFLKPR